MHPEEGTCALVLEALAPPPPAGCSGLTGWEPWCPPNPPPPLLQASGGRRDVLSRWAGGLGFLRQGSRDSGLWGLIYAGVGGTEARAALGDWSPGGPGQEGHGPLGEPGRLRAVRAGSSSAGPGVNQKGQGLGSGRGSWATWAAEQEPHPSRVLAAAFALSPLGPRRAGCTAVCWLQLAEPQVVLGPLRSSSGGPSWGASAESRAGSQAPRGPCSVQLWCLRWLEQQMQGLLVPPPARLSAPCMAGMQRGVSGLLRDTGRVPPPALAGPVSPVSWSLSGGWRTWASLPWSVACPPRGGLLPPVIAQDWQSPSVQAQPVTRLLPACSPGSCFSTGPESPVWKSHGVGQGWARGG